MNLYPPTAHAWSNSRHSFMETWVPLFLTVCVCPSHPGCGPTPCLECVHASVHEFMSIWLPKSGPTPMHSFKENWVPLYSSVFLSQSPHFCSYTLFRMCTCIYVPCLCCHTFFRMCTISSTWIYVHLTTHVSSIPYAQFYGILCAPMCHCVCPSHPACGPLSCLECVHAWVHDFMSTWLPTSGPPHTHSLMETLVPLYGVCLCPSHLISVPTPCLECVHASVHQFMSTLLPRSAAPHMHSFMEP